MINDWDGPNGDDEMHLPRQGQRVDIVLSGDKRDVDKVFHELISRYNHLPYSFDFEVTPTSTKIILHPWAVND